MAEVIYEMRTLINLIATFVAFSSSIAINFFLTPFIVEKLGVAAYGYIALSNDFLAYLSILTIAINSMSARFITIATHRGNIQEAREYYASAIAANIILGSVLLIPSILFLVFLERIIAIPLALLWDVKLLYALNLLGFFLTMITATFGVAYIICNKLFIQAAIGVCSNVLRLVILLMLFGSFSPYIFYMGLGGIISIVLLRVADCYYQYKLIPNIRFSWQNVHFFRCKEMLSSGVWNSIVRVGNICTNNVDLLMVNVLLTPNEMGILAVVKLVPNFLWTVTGLMAGVYTPKFLKLYAENNKDGLKDTILEGMKVFAILISLPLVLLMSMGDIFFSLWVPSQDSTFLYELSLLSFLAVLVIGPAAILHTLFTVVNRVRTNSILVVLTGLLTVVANMLILRYTDWGLYGIVAATAGIGLVRNLIYTVPYVAKYLGYRKRTFFPLLLRSLLCILALAGMSRMIAVDFVFVNTWSMFFIMCAIYIIMIIAIEWFFIFDLQERTKIKTIVKKLI